MKPRSIGPLVQGSLVLARRRTKQIIYLLSLTRDIRLLDEGDSHYKIPGVQGINTQFQEY